MPKQSTPPAKPAGPKAITIDLPLEQAAQLRKLSAGTGLTQAHLRGELTRSREVATAITAALEQIYADWKEDLDGLFVTATKEAPDA